MLKQYYSALIGSLTLAMLAVFPAHQLFFRKQPLTQGAAVSSTAVLVELFTSEGCSDCPPADALLRQVNGRKTPGWTADRWHQ